MQFFKYIILFCILSQPLYAQKYDISYFGTQSAGQFALKAGKYTIQISGGDGLAGTVSTTSGKYTVSPGIFSYINPAIPVSQIDSMILVRIYEETYGDNWIEPWVLTDSVYTWGGVQLNEEGHVTRVDLSSNNLTGTIPTRWAYPDSLFVIDNFDRLTQELGNVEIDVFGNRLDFGSLEPTHDLLGEFFFKYDSQAVIGTPLDTTVLRGVDVPLIIETSGNFNTYQWYFNNNPITDATDSLYRIKGMNYVDTGVYFCEIKNTIATKTTLQTYEMRVNIADPITVQDSLNLVKFFTVTNGHNWSNPWQLENPVISWKGLVFKNSKLVEINLSDNNLSGEIPNFMDTASVFQNIVSLNLSANNLSGTIPESLGNLENLILLDLDKNDLTGKIPSSFTKMKNLRTLWISRNKLTHFPDTVYHWEKLQYLFAHQNQIVEIPPSFGQLAELKLLNLNDNNLTIIPEYVEGLRALEIFYVARNQLIDIHTNIANLSFLNTFDLTKNNLTVLPSTMRSFEAMKQLKIGNNALQFGSLENLVKKYILVEYTPQKEIGEAQEFSLNTSDKFEISVTVSGENNTYQWYKDNIKIAGATQSVFTIESVNNNDVGIYHCLINNSDADELILRNLPTTLNIACGDGLSVALSSADKLEYCPDAEIITELQAEISQEDVEIRWFRDNVQLYGTNKTNLFANTAGIYHLRVTDKNGCSVSSNKVEITTLPERYADIRADSSVIYMYETDAEIVDYQWYYYDQIIEGAIKSSYSADKDGVYALQFTDKNGCQTYSNTIRVTNTAIEDESNLDKSINVYPNPIRDFFYVGTPLSLGEVRLHVFSINGQEMTNVGVSESGRNEKRLDMRQLPSGVYVLTIATDEGDIIRRIVKQ